MQITQFSFSLPEHLIAQYPLATRTASRLLVLGRDGVVKDSSFSHILSLLDTKDLLVFNDTRVIPARLFGTKETGGKVEILIERLLDNRQVWAHLRASKTPKLGTIIRLENSHAVRVMGREHDLFVLQFLGDTPVLDVLQQIGHMPLPPYMDREDEFADRERYQTVYANKQGAVAAPTAGLHFDEALLEAIKVRGIETAFITLHVGAGTFQPVRVKNIYDHVMHKEWLEVSESVSDAVRRCKQRGGRVIAVGTTSVRSLETASRGGDIAAFSGDSDIFIYPGFEFHCVDAMITNFHLPQSTLLMLVCAFAGYEHVMNAYHHAIQQEYRFYSYGDAMFIERSHLSGAEIVQEANQAEIT